MKSLTKTVFYITIFLGSALILATLLSLLTDIKYWYLKALDFPRLQVWIALIAVLVLFLLSKPRWHISAKLFLAGIVASLLIQSLYLYPYTPLVEPRVRTIAAEEVADTERISLLVANVWMKNNAADKLLALVDSAAPDMVLAMETNQRWLNQLKPLQEAYPHTVLYPLDNTYGMALYSKLPLHNTDIKFFNHDKVPSIHTDVRMPDGASFRLHAMHPVPPKPSEHPDNVGEEEVALTKLGDIVAQRTTPTIVAGDFNDVAWSNTSNLFGESSKLLDVRVGRGLYNSFDATSSFMRWPLDHVYVSDEFQVVELKRLPFWGSDHFPIYVSLALKR